MSSKTPRCDKEEYNYPTYSPDTSLVVDADFARELESELSTKTQQLKEAKKHLKLVLVHNGINTLGRIKIEQFLKDVE